MAQTPVSEPDIQRILSTIKQVESGGNYGIKAQGSSASGAYQFIDKTWQDSTKKYGIGTEYKSAKDAPPEIQDAVAQRAVRDILGQVGGDVSKVPLVWYTGNPQGRMTEEQIKANQGQTADQYQKKWLATFGRGATTKVVTAPAAQPSTATRGPRTTAQVGGGMTLASLPENYRIALATSYLGETEDPEEAVAEKALRLVEESQQGGGAAKTQKLLAQAVPDETVNPFKFLEREPEPQRRRPVPRIPRMMAAGGPVGEMAGTQAMEVDGFSDGGMAELTDEEKQKAFEEHQARTMAQARYFMGPMVASAVKKPGGYEARIAAPIRGVEPYVDVNPMSGRIQPTEYGVQYGQMGPQGGYQLRYSQPIAPSGMKVPPQITGQYRRQLDRDSEIQASGFYAPIPNMRDAYGANVRYVRRFEKGGEVEQNPADIAEQMTVGTRPSPPKYPPTMLSREEGIRMIRSRTPGLFGPLGPLVGNYIVKKGYLPPTIQEFLGYPPPADVWDPEELKKTYGEKEVVRRQAGSPEEGEVAAQQMTVGTLPEDQKPAGQVFRGIGRDIVRGAQYLPYDLLGAPVDIATMAMRPFGYNVEKPVGGSEYLIEKARQAGIAQAPTGSAAETATRIGMGFVNPAAVARQIPKGIAAIERGAETLGTGAVRAITGKPDITPEQIYQAVGDTKGILQLGAPAAVKPSGGVVNADEMVDSLTNVLKFDVKAEGQKFDDIFKWIDTKARSYYEKQFGSPSDPLFRAFMSGDFDPQFNHINNTVRETYEDTIKHGRDLMSSTSTADQRVGRAMLSNIYDAVTPIVAQYGPQTIRNRLLNPKFREEIQRYIMEERNLGPAKLTPKARLNYEKEIDSYLDEFAKTGNLSTKAPFDVVDINKAASQNIVDDVGNKIETQTRKTFNLSDESYGFLGQWPGYGTALEKTHALPSAYSKNYPDYLATTAERQAVKFGEPTYFISKQPEEVHADLRNLIGYLNRTPADEWKNTSFPDLVVKAQKDYSNITDPQEIYKRLNNYQKVTPKQRLIGTQEFMPVESKQLGEGATWRELDENGILIEGRLLRHCLSEDEKYRNFYKNGMSRFFALRDKEGKSYATIQIDRLGMDGPFANVHQIKGWKNDSVGKKYDKEIMDFLNRYQANQINVPLRYTEESSFLPVSLAGGERVRVVEGDAPFVRQYVEFFRTLDRNLIDRGMATPEDLGDFNYVLDRIRDLPTEAQQKEFADTFLKAFAEGYNKPLKFIYHLGGWRTGQLGEPQPVWQNPPVNRAKGGMVDKPLYDRAA